VTVKQLKAFQEINRFSSFVSSQHERKKCRQNFVSNASKGEGKILDRKQISIQASVEKCSESFQLFPPPTPKVPKLSADGVM
jgi:hypothetical protein